MKNVIIFKIFIPFLLIICYRFFFITILDYNKMKLFYSLFPYIGKNKKKPKSLKEIYESNILYINDSNITKEYIKHMRIIENGSKKHNAYLWKDIKFGDNIFSKRKDQLNYTDYGKLCMEEKLINSNTLKIYDSPTISIIIPSFNKENIILKSIRSIQNQSIKNIEIIIVDDFSTDQSNKIYDYLVKSDPRVRIFYHLKNLGVWRSRIDGFLYSKGKYIIFFDAGDLYEDNYVLEDELNIIEKYNLDAVKTICRFIYDFQNLTNSKKAIIIKHKYTKIAFQPNIKKYDKKLFKNFGWIWTTLIKRNIFTKGLSLLSTKVLNFYKNYWDDQWWKKLSNYLIENLLILKRYSYLYYKNGNGEGDFKINTQEERNKMIQEHLEFLHFDLEFPPENDNKIKIINKLRKYNNNNHSLNLEFLKSKFYLLDDLANELIKDKNVSDTNKTFLKQLLKHSKQRQKIILKNFK